MGSHCKPKKPPFTVYVDELERHLAGDVVCLESVQWDRYSLVALFSSQCHAQAMPFLWPAIGNQCLEIVDNRRPGPLLLEILIGVIVYLVILGALKPQKKLSSGLVD